MKFNLKEKVLSEENDLVQAVNGTKKSEDPNRLFICGYYQDSITTVGKKMVAPTLNMSRDPENT